MERGSGTKTEIITKKKKTRGHVAHHGGAWKVAYADFVTAMMAFFMVMWLIGQNQATREAIASYFRDPGVFETTATSSLMDGEGDPHEGAGRAGMAADDAIRQELRDAADHLRKQLDAAAGLEGLDKQVDVRLTSEGLRIELIDSDQATFFDTGSAELKPEAVRLLGLMTGELKALARPIIVEGHTDARQYSHMLTYSNWELSADRANAARRIILKGGLPPRLIMSVRGYADRKLRFGQQPLDARNRRVSVVVPLGTAVSGAP
ncbi:MAG: flagellar motor protein MotB [Acidobacteriota bacterium]